MPFSVTNFREGCLWDEGGSTNDEPDEEDPPASVEELNEACKLIT
jgi:hypothetical protein